MENILKAKHWQIFLFTFGLPFILELILILMSIESLVPGTMVEVMPLILLLFLAGIFIWFWSIGIGLQSKIPIGVKMKVTKFKLFLILPFIYMLVFLVIMEFMTNGLIENGQQSNVLTAIGTFAIILPMHVLSMFGMLYSLYFVAKTFKTVELQREVTFSDFAGEFFMIWFFPIGIWIIQPKINKMIE
jgi:hypothetical protein